MKRKIKFRGKGKHTNIWHFGFLSEIETGRYVSTSGLDNPVYSMAVGKVVVKEDTIGQYTGIKDKNGKEIYEGDILNVMLFPNEEYRCTCEFNQPTASFLLSGTKLPFDDMYKMHELDKNCYEVIGNIYDNPGLLKIEQHETHD